MNNALLVIGGLLVAFFAALFAVPAFVDWNGYRGVFEEEASKVFGRDVRVGGGVNVRLLPAPYVRFEKVRLADVTGQTGEPFLRAESFTMWLSGPALLRGVVEASRIELEKPVLSLALDGQGGGNWASIQITPGDLPFVPRDVALRSVNVTGGSIVVADAAANRIARVDGVEGELSADGLKGPFRFKGVAEWSGAAREVRFATTEPASDGSYRLKLAIKSPSTAATATIDGSIADLAGKPKFHGTLTAKAPVPGVEDASDGPPLLDVTSKVEVTAEGAKFDDVSLSLADVAEPQIITGTATSHWGGDGASTDIVLKSKWLDLDRLSGARADTAQFARVRKMGLGLMAAVVGTGSGRARIDVEQVKIGGETAGGLKIDAERRGSTLTITELKSGLPGGTRLDVVGDVKDEAGKPAFTGRGFVRGRSLARLKDWAGKSGTPIDIKADGSFSVEGTLAFSDAVFQLSEAYGDISGQPISGSIRVVGGERQAIDVALESTRLDTTQFFPTTARAVEASLRQALGLAASDKAAENKPFDGDMTLRLLAAELAGPEDTFRDVDMAMTFKGGDINITRARLTANSGLTIGVEGRVSNIAQAPKGSLGFDISGASAEALRDIPRLFNIASLVEAEQLAGLRDGRIAGLATIGARSASSIDITFDGEARGSRVSGAMEFDAGLEGWRSAPSRLQVSIDAPALRVLPLFAGVKAVAGAHAGSAPATARFSAAGVAGREMALKAEIRGEGFSATFDGQGTLPAEGERVAQGTLVIAAREVSDVLAAIGLAPPAGMAGAKADGTIEIVRSGPQLRLATRGFSIGMSKLDGTADVSAAKGEPHGVSIVTGSVKSDRVSLLSLVSALTDAVPTSGAEDADAAALEKGLWPVGVFNFSLLDQIEGGIDVAFGQLDVSGNLSTGPGSFALAVEPGAIKIGKLAADAAGGKLDAELTLTKQPDGVALQSRVSLDGADLKRFSSVGRGTASLSATGAGRAQSPAGLIAVLAGDGTVKIADATLPVPDAATAYAVAEQIVDAKLPNDPERVTAAFAEGLQRTAGNLGSRDLAITIADGAAKLAQISIDGDRGSLSASTTVDLMSLDLTSSWFLTTSVKPLAAPAVPLPDWTPPPDKGPLPAATVTYTGRLDDLGSVQAMVESGDFQREIAVRQMERNVQELELMRRSDEERARLEKERRKALEAERAAAAAAAKAEREAARQKRDGYQMVPPQQQPQPPIVPESLDGTNGDPAVQQPPNGTSSAQPAAGASPTAAGEQPAATGAGTPQVSADGAPSATTTPSGDTGLAGTTTITIEPDAPATEATPKPKPAQRAQRPRTTNDELMRSLGGGFP